MLVPSSYLLHISLYFMHHCMTRILMLYYLYMCAWGLIQHFSLDDVKCRVTLSMQWLIGMMKRCWLLSCRQLDSKETYLAKISFFAIKLSTREQSASFHDHRSNWEFIWRISYRNARSLCWKNFSKPVYMEHPIDIPTNNCQLLVGFSYRFFRPHPL